MSEACELDAQALPNGVFVATEHVGVIACRPADRTLLGVVPRRAPSSSWRRPFLRGFHEWARAWFSWSDAHAAALLELPEAELPPGTIREMRRGRVTVTELSASPFPGLRLPTEALFPVVLFVLAPQLLAVYLLPLFDVEVNLASPSFHLTTAIVSFLVAVVYLAGISAVDDVKGVFRRHSAVSRALSAIQSGGPLTRASLQNASSFHPRSNAVAISLQLAVATAAFSAAGMIGLSYPPSVATHAVLVGAKILALPLVYAVARELQHAVGVLYRRAPVSRGPIRAVFVLHWLTVRKPEDADIALALAAARELRRRDPVLGGAARDGEEAP